MARGMSAWFTGGIASNISDFRSSRNAELWKELRANDDDELAIAFHA